MVQQQLRRKNSQPNKIDMQKTLTKKVRLILIIAILSVINMMNSFSQEYKGGVLQGKIRVKIQPSISASIKIDRTVDKGIVTTNIQSLDKLNSTYNISEMDRVFPPVKGMEEKYSKYGLDLWYEITFSAKSASNEAIVEAYGKLPEIAVAEPIHEIRLIQPGKPVMADLAGSKSSGDQPYNDPYLPKQWHYNNTGQTGGKPGADINLYNAWKISTGSPNVIVAIMDQGVDFSHEDLAANMWVNQAELNGLPNVDDDGNGYKDDIYGFNFADNMGKINPDFHGTHVAGTIAAINDNGIGVAGIAGGSATKPGVRLMSCQILGGVSQGNLPNSYVYAANNGAVISQNSWGYTSVGTIDQAVLTGIDYFIAEAGNYPGSPMKGGVVIFAAGNDNWEGEWWPGCYDKVISVSALNASFTKASYSNFAPWVDISAPGGESSDDYNMPGSQQQSGYSNAVLSTFNNNGYGYLEGTSMACPHVTGVTALIVSKYGGPVFTPDELKKHLLTGVSNIDTIPGNSNYTGKLGAGAINAALALAADNGFAPATISDLAFNGVAQDFTVLNWTIPADKDDGRPYSFEVIYSKEPISETSMEFARSLVIKNDKEAGEMTGYEVNGLDGMTKYYFAVRSLDRWGNRSSFSNQISATTNNGPDAWIDKSGFSFQKKYVGWDPVRGSIYDTIWYKPITINTTATKTGNTSFYLHNTGEGVLRWNLIPRHVETIDAYNNSHINYPKLAGPLGSFKAKISSVTAPKLPVNIFSQDPNDKFLEYLDRWNTHYFIGETDTAFTNSAATKFVVKDAEGFNLTDANIFLNYTSTKLRPAVLEIYFGEDISTAKLTYAQELTATTKGWNYIKLDEQIFMKQGTPFWMVIHIPSGNLYPLGAALELDPSYSKNCYISLNMGKSWHMFEDLYYNNLLVWAMTAVSNYKTPGDIITLLPESGDLPAGDSVKITASVDGSKMISGQYKTSVVINTNEVREPMLRANVWTTVSGQKPVISGQNIVSYGSVLLGNEKLLSITVKNNGYGKFKSPSITISDPQFRLVGYLSEIQARSEYTFQMIYKPGVVGNANAKITLRSSGGDQFIFNVFGVGTEPPVLKLSPDNTTFDNLMIGDSVSGEFYVKNTGKYPLTYYFPSFSSGTNVGELKGDFCKFGYSAKLNPDGVYSDPSFEWVDISTTGTDIKDYSTEREFWFYDVEMGFNFPFFGKMENHVFITNYGLVSFDKNSVFNFSPLMFKNSYSPDRFISALGYRHSVNIMGNIYYQDFGDRFIIQFDHVNYTSFDQWTWEMVNIPVTYQIVLHSNGNINFYYKDMGGADPYSMNGDTYTGIEDQNADDGLVISDQNHPDLLITNNTTVEIINPGLGLLTSMTNPDGTVQPGDSLKVTYVAKTDILNVADYTEKIPVLSNDPFNNPGIYTIQFNVTGGGTPDIHLSDTTYNFGRVFQGDALTFNLWVVNKGRANDTITSASFSKGYFSISGNLPSVAAPSRKILYSVGAKADLLGIFQDTLIVSTSLGKKFKVALRSEVVEAPQISVSPEFLIDTLSSGKSFTNVITVKNNGGNDLEFAPTGNNWITVSEAATKSMNIPAFRYNWTKNTESTGTDYKWIDIVSPVNRIDSIDAWPTYAGPGWTYWSEGIRLPFKFNFYGNDYDTLYIGFNGVVTFTREAKDSFHPFGGTNIPDTTAPNNFIAPLWSFAYLDASAYKEAGVYYKVYDDKIVVEWHRFVDGFYMGWGISWEVVLYPDGNIKFQYDFGGNNEEFLSNFGVIGLENNNGTDGTLVAYHTYGFLTDKMAISLNPLKKYFVPAGSSKQLNVELNAKELYAGDYTSDLVLLNNTPGTGKLKIPVQLHVTGEANISVPDSIDFGKVMSYTFVNDWGSTQQMEYTREFEIKNSGTARIEISAFDISNLLGSTVEAYVLAADWMGNLTWQWYDVMNLPVFDWNCWCNIPLYLEPKSSLKLRAKISPASADPIRDSIIILTDYQPSPSITVVISADPVLPPVTAISDKEIVVYAPTKQYTDSRSFYISNRLGHSELDYNMELAFERETPAASASEANAATNSSSKSGASAIPLQAKPMVTSTKSQKNGTMYNRVLEYNNATTPETSLGYGGNYMFATSTKFRAPDDGFNLTHVQTWYRPGNWLNSKIIVEVWSGAPVLQNSSVIYTQEYHHNISSPDDFGGFITIELQQNLIFYPKEDFFIVFKYPTGADYPQGVVNGTSVTAGRYMYGNGQEWFDIANASGFERSCWMVKAIENEYASNVWVDMVSPQNGTIAAGDSAKITLKFAAAYANSAVNKAKVTINSNDPYHSNGKVNVTMRLNQGPVFGINKTALSVNENENIRFFVAANDMEKDNFTMTMTGSKPFISSTFGKDTIFVTCSPTYDDAGIYSLTFTGQDEFGSKSEALVTLTVNNVNRSPVVIDSIPDNGVVLDVMSNFDLTKVIADPDNEQLVYDVTSSNQQVVKVFMSNDACILTPVALGTTLITIKGTDAGGLSATHSFNFKVMVTDVENIPTGEISLYPNPSSGILELILPSGVKGASRVVITDILGNLLREVNIRGNESPVRFDISGFAPGIYIFHVIGDNFEKSLKVIRK